VQCPVEGILYNFILFNFIYFIHAVSTVVKRMPARGENTKINHGMDTRGEKKKEDVQEKHGWKEYKQP
jgi:hypothetical protein